MWVGLTLSTERNGNSVYKASNVPYYIILYYLFCRNDIISIPHLKTNEKAKVAGPAKKLIKKPNSYLIPK